MWSNKTFAPLREAVAYLITKHVDVFYGYDQLANHLHTFFKTNSTTDVVVNTMADFTKKILEATFEKSKHSAPYEPYSTIFDDEEVYSDYYIHIDKTNGRVACSKSKDSSAIRLVNDNEASDLLSGLAMDETMYNDVQGFLVRRKQTQHKGKRKKRPGGKTNVKAIAAERSSTPKSPNRPPSATGSVKSATSVKSPDPKRPRPVAPDDNTTDVVSAGLPSDSARTFTPLDAPTRPAPALSPSTKSPNPKRGRASTDPPVLRAVSTDEDTPTNRPTNNAAYDFKAMLYDDNDRLREEVVAILREDKEYALIDRRTNRDVRVSAAAKVIAPRFKGDPKTWTSSVNSSSTASNTIVYIAMMLSVGFKQIEILA